MIDPNEITGLILAGGMARRMGGTDKGLISLRDKPLIEYVIDQFRPQVGKLYINANRNLSTYGQYGHEVISDTLSGYQGPLAGMAAGMEKCATPYLVTAPCDSPKLPTDYVARAGHAMATGDAEISVGFDGERIQPVHVMLKTSLLPSLVDFLESGERKIDRWFAQHKMVKADFSDQTDMFVNANTPEQLAALAELELKH